MLLLVTGASGVGKSTARRLLADEVAPSVRVVELAQVVEIPARYDISWRQQSVEQVVQAALVEQEAGRHLLLAGDPVAPGEVLAAPSADRLEGFAACLLDCAPAEQERRLRARGDPPELLPSHLAFAEWMRGHARDPAHRLDVIAGGWSQMRWERLPSSWEVAEIDTTGRSPAGVAAEVLAWCRDVLRSAGTGCDRGEKRPRV
jgi:NAD(P)-dependent dehydrogenase (short-subunit alcohol dehydrogenase family)